MYPRAGPVHGGIVYLISEALEGDFAPRWMPVAGMPVSDPSTVRFVLLGSNIDPRAAFYVLRALPSPVGRLSRPAAVSTHSSRSWQVACSFPDPDPRSNALAQSVAAGCEGFRTDLWLHENQLLIGVSRSGPKAASHLRFHLDSLLKRLEPQAASAGSQIAMSADHMNNDPHRTFILALDAKSRFHEIYPRLVSQLDTLRQRGYLSHWDGAEMVRGPVTVVVTGEPVPSSDCSSYSYADVFWSTNEGDISQDGVTNDYLSPICAV